ncbi:hypothetical protein [Alkalihalobacillus sp. AL-G]|uniref:hypothetical protein n=1 Tax=Alkalihalobacillus sp. AL-G TaxID=2926399 RepID=UPI00272A6F74|nr:hypothetical protein [Alkalihalobacillus sp. AL-G]WLD94301.1 hypothetical protein MOJ78_05250 [Alkalihalobacillus sp. AL-G]
MGWFYLEANDIEGIKFRIVISVGIYLFIVFFAIFYSLYKISMISHNKRFKNIFLFLMSFLLRTPFQKVESIVGEKEELTIKRIWKEIRMEVLIVFFTTLWLVGALITGLNQIQEFKQ